MTVDIVGGGFVLRFRDFLWKIGFNSAADIAFTFKVTDGTDVYEKYSVYFYRKEDQEVL